jgi:ankyrin repeat protein
MMPTTIFDPACSDIVIMVQHDYYFISRSELLAILRADQCWKAHIPQNFIMMDLQPLQQAMPAEEIEAFLSTLVEDGELSIDYPFIGQFGLSHAIMQAYQSKQPMPWSTWLDTYAWQLSFPIFHGEYLPHFMVRQNDPLTLEILFKYMDIALYADAYGVTPLHLAVTYEYQGCFDVLIAASEGFLHADQDGWDPLHIALCQGTEWAIETLRSQAHPRSTAAYGYYYLDLAVMHAREAHIDYFCQFEGHVNRFTKAGKTALILAVLYQQESSMKRLLSHGADINQACQQYHMTPLHWAIYSQAPMTILLTLLGHRGVDLAAVANGRVTILHLAAIVGNTSLVSHLLQVVPLLIHQPLDNGLTAIDCAVYYDHTAVVSLLQAAGAVRLRASSVPMANWLSSWLPPIEASACVQHGIFQAGRHAVRECAHDANNQNPPIWGSTSPAKFPRVHG